MRLLPATGHRRMPWKNGGGETLEVARSPPGAPLDAVDWRVSLATVASGGPFSVFPGLDRTLTVLDGEGLCLAVAGLTPATLLPTSPPFSFSGDAAATATPIGGPVLDLNVMTRRPRFRHSVERLDLDGPLELGPLDRAGVLLCAAGIVEVTDGREGFRLAALDALLAEGPGNGRWKLRGAGPASLIVVRIRDDGGP